MPFYKIMIVTIFIFFTTSSVTQNDLETLEKMHHMVENKRANESKAREIIWSYNTYLKDVIREKRGELTQKEFDYLNDWIEMTWGQIIEHIKTNNNGSYAKFYNQQGEFLLNHKKKVLDKLYAYINKPLEIEQVKNQYIDPKDSSDWNDYDDERYNHEDYNPYDAINPKPNHFDFLKKAKEFFEQYIVVRLQELDEDGQAYEHEKAREYYIGDINLDGIPDVVVLFTVEGVGGGNNWYRHILLLPNLTNEISDINHSLVYGTLRGSGEFVGIRNGYAVFDLLNYSSNNLKDILDEGRPSKYQRLGYGIRGNEMVIDEIADK